MLKQDKPTLVLLAITWKSIKSFLVYGFTAFFISYAIVLLVSSVFFVSLPSCRTRIEEEKFFPNFSQAKVGFSVRQMGDYCNFGDYIYRLEVVRFVNGKESDKTEIYKDFTNSFPAIFRWLSTRELLICSKIDVSGNIGTVKETVQWNGVKITKRLNISSEIGAFDRECNSRN